MVEETKYLVLGATGKTGTFAVKQLTQKGLQVRAFVRRLDDRSKALESFGAEVVVGDFLDISTLRSAMEGIKRAYFCYPPADRLLEATANLALVGKEVGLEAVVNMSQIEVRDGHKSLLANQHWLGEHVLECSGIPVTHIRPTFFADMFPIMNGKNISSEGKIYLPHGNGKHAPVAAEDIARVAVGILTNPEPHKGKVYKITGPKSMTIYEMAEIFSKVLEKPVEYVDIPLENWQKALEAFGLSPFLIQHLGHMAIDHQNGYFDGETDVVEKIGGKEPLSLEDFIIENIEVFGGKKQAS